MSETYKEDDASTEKGEVDEDETEEEGVEEEDDDDKDEVEEGEEGDDTKEEDDDENRAESTSFRTRTSTVSRSFAVNLDCSCQPCKPLATAARTMFASGIHLSC